MNFIKLGIFISLLLSSSYLQADIFKAREAIVAQEFDVAEELLTALAHIGNSEAHYTLGVLHFQGKIGEVDKIGAFAWLVLAAGNKYPDAERHAQEAFISLSESEQIVAVQLAKELGRRYAKQSLQTSIFPSIRTEPFSEQVIDVAAIEVQKSQLTYDDLAFIDKRARAFNASAQQSAELKTRLNKGYRHNASEYLSKVQQNNESGLVIVNYSLNDQGKIQDSDTLFSWPPGRFDKPVHDAVRESVYSPAKRNGIAVKQHGLVTSRRIGVEGGNTFRVTYPITYRHFIRLKKVALDTGNLDAKYQYACMLRAYGDIMSGDKTNQFPVLLAELAESEHVLAQLDYANYLIFQQNKLDLGIGWLVKSAQTGYAPAMYKLGSIMLSPPSSLIQKDLVKAKFWFDKAASLGHENAKEKLTL